MKIPQTSAERSNLEHSKPRRSRTSLWGVVSAKFCAAFLEEPELIIRESNIPRVITPQSQSTPLDVSSSELKS